MIKFRRILVPTDFSDFAKRAIDYACAMPMTENSEIILAHVIEPTIYPIHQVIQRHDALSFDQQVKKTCNNNLEDIAKEFSDRVALRPALLEGHPVGRLLGFADEEEVDLIVIATHGRTGLKHLFMGSTAEQVVRRAPCPVLTVRTEMAQ